MSKVYGMKVGFSDDLDMIQKLLEIFVKIKTMENPEKELRKGLIPVLSLYIMEGFSSETKELIKKSLNKTTKNLNQINSELTSKGYLVVDRYNFRVKHVSDELMNFKNYFLNSKNKVLLLKMTDKS